MFIIYNTNIRDITTPVENMPNGSSILCWEKSKINLNSKLNRKHRETQFTVSSKTQRNYNLSF